MMINCDRWRGEERREKKEGRRKEERSMMV
jgi:hypothetical protein